MCMKKTRTNTNTNSEALREQKPKHSEILHQQVVILKGHNYNWKKVAKEVEKVLQELHKTGADPIVLKFWKENLKPFKSGNMSIWCFGEALIIFELYVKVKECKSQMKKEPEYSKDFFDKLRPMRYVSEGVNGTKYETFIEELTANEPDKEILKEYFYIFKCMTDEEYVAFWEFVS